MTIRMQESEAAADFSRFLAYLEAGDEVQLEREGTPLTIRQVDGRDVSQGHASAELEPVPRRGSLEAAQAFFKWYAPMLGDEAYVRAMQEAREAFNQPLEPRF